MTRRTRQEIVDIIGKEYLTSNIENDEFSYYKAYQQAKIPFKAIKSKRKDRSFKDLDRRFVKDDVTVLVETKNDYTKDKDSEEQLEAYVIYEKGLTNNKIIAILANEDNENIKVWRGAISTSDFLENETSLRSMEEYVDFYTSKVNDKEKVIQNTYNLNELLHTYGIEENLRAPFVGTCLLALKNSIKYTSPDKSAGNIRQDIKETLEGLLTKDINKATKIALLNKNVLEQQTIRDLKVEELRDVLNTIEKDILPYINDRSTAGQDLLNLFFVTFNKYAGKKDKNQAFTPDHITEFMSDVAGVNKNTIVLDPCCGSGSFLVRAMTKALDNCATAKEQEEVKKHNIWGFEYDEVVFGLATTNMLIHGDGNSNIYQGSCFKLKDKIKEARPTVILMNPPYNGTRKCFEREYYETWGKNNKGKEISEDPSKGFYFVKFIADELNKLKIQATIAVLLPMACAIGGKNKKICEIKRQVLKENTLDAVFSLPPDIFHPGATASVCCMIFKTGIPHNSIANPPTFFGYFRDDGFKKKKALGRIEQKDNVTGEGRWQPTKNSWLSLYSERKKEKGLSVTQKVTGDDEWLAEAYMDTDYTKLTQKDFEKSILNYVLFKTSTDSISDEEENGY